MPTRTPPAVVVAACCLVVFLPGALIFAFPGVMSPHWQATLQVGKADVGQVMFFILAAAGTCMFVAGRLQTKVAPAKLIAAGTLLYAGSTVFLGRVASIREVYAWAFLIGAGSAFVYLPAVTVAQRWYPLRRGMAAGLVNLFFALSAAATAPLFEHALHALGYPRTTVLISAVTLVVGLGGVLLVRLPPDEPGAAGRPQAPVVSLTVRQSLQTRDFWFLWLTYALAGAAGIAMVPLAVPFGLAQGLNALQAVTLLMAFNLTNGLGRLVSGYLSDLTGRRGIMSLSFLAAGGAYGLLPFLEGLAAWSLAAAVVGFAFGTLFAVSAPLIGDRFGMEHFGSIFGLVFTAYGFFSGLLGPWFSGLLLDTFEGRYTLVFFYLGSLMLFSGLMTRFISARQPPPPV